MFDKIYNIFVNAGIISFPTTYSIGSTIKSHVGEIFKIKSIDVKNDFVVLIDKDNCEESCSFWYLHKMCKLIS